VGVLLIKEPLLLGDTWCEKVSCWREKARGAWDVDTYVVCNVEVPDIINLFPLPEKKIKITL
jgi:hypothetical protein